MSTFVGWFNVTAIFTEEQQWYYLTHSNMDKGIHTFPKGMSPKVSNSTTGVQTHSLQSCSLVIKPQGVFLSMILSHNVVFLNQMCNVCIYPAPPPWVRCNTRSIFKQRIVGLKKNFLSPRLVAIATQSVQIFMLNDDRKIPLTCHISCVGGITGWAPVLLSKQDTGIPQQKCCGSYMGGMQGRRRVHMQCIGGTCNHENCVGIQIII